jgi:hypothetical protein
MSYTLGIPAANNNPSADQPLMLGNFTAINNWTVVDHIGFNTGDFTGQHLQVTFATNPNFIPTPPNQSANNSILFTQAGTATDTNAMLFFQNSNSGNLPYPVSMMRAYGQYPGASVNGTVVANNQNNVTSVSRNSQGNYTVILVAGAVTTNNYGVTVSCDNRSVTSGRVNLVANVNLTSTPGTFTLLFHDVLNNNADPTTFTFLALQV